MDVSHITSPYFTEAVAYAQEIAEGRVLANRARKLACQRFLNDLQRDDLDFKDGQFDLAIKLIEGTIHHVRGEGRAGVSYKGRPMILAPWQKFVIVNLFGFFKKGTSIRRYTEALIFLPRKQGKTSFSAALGEVKSIIDRASGAVTYIVANSVKQTMESFQFLKDNIEDLRPDVKKLRIRDNNQEHSISVDFGDGTAEIWHHCKPKKINWILSTVTS